MKTPKEMCEIIIESGILEDKTLTPEDIFNASPNGELQHLSSLFMSAMVLLGRASELDIERKDNPSIGDIAMKDMVQSVFYNGKWMPVVGGYY